MDNEKEIKPKKTGKLKQSFASQQFKSGAYSSFVTILVIALVVIVNLVFHRLDLSTDLSSDGLFTLSKDTEEVVKGMEDNVTIYYMVQKGQEESYIQKVIDQYKKVSDHVKVVTKDPVVNPGFSKQFVEDEVADNDVIVVNDDTSAAKYIASTDMLYTDSYPMDGSGQVYLDVEGRVTSAIQYVLADDVQKIYVMSGHGEQELSENLRTSLEKMNMEVNDLTLVTEGEVPEDCSVLFLYGPAKDLEDSEKNAILKYLKAGGDAIILPIYTGKEMPNLEGILEYYGMGLQKGIIFEGAGHYDTYLNWIVPETDSDSDVMAGVSGDEYFVLADAQSLTMADSSSLRSTLSITGLLTTSNRSMLKVNPESGVSEKEKGDLDGPFFTGLYAEETVGEETTRLIVYSTAMFRGSLLEYSFRALTGSQEGGTYVSIDSKNLSYSSVTMNIGSQIFWAVFLIIILPVGLLIAGFGIWFVRRRK